MCATSAYGKAYTIVENYVPQTKPSINPCAEPNLSEYAIIEKSDVAGHPIENVVNRVSNKDIFADTVKNVYQDIKMTKERAKNYLDQPLQNFIPYSAIKTSAGVVCDRFGIKGKEKAELVKIPEEVINTCVGQTTPRHVLEYAKPVVSFVMPTLSTMYNNASSSDSIKQYFDQGMKKAQKSIEQIRKRMHNISPTAEKIGSRKTYTLLKNWFPIQFHKKLDDVMKETTPAS
jgi:hypothetical protein